MGGGGDGGSKGRGRLPLGGGLCPCLPLTQGRTGKRKVSAALLSLREATLPSTDSPKPGALHWGQRPGLFVVVTLGVFWH